MPWVSAPDDAVLERIAAALADADRSGVVLVGPDGAGKSLTARVAAERFAAEQPSTVVRWVTGTPSERMIPFGAFGGLIEVAEIGRPAALLRAAHDSLVGGDLLLVVNDAQQLDELSATLVYHLALRRSARLIVTARAHSELPDAVTALWADGLLTRVDIEPVDDSAALRELIDDYLSGLSAPARAVLDHLAVAEPLQRSDLAALVGEQAVGAAETADAITADADGMVRAAHPLYTDRARAALASGTARRLRTAIVEQLSTRPSGRVSDQLRIAALAVDSDAPHPDLTTAAEQALRLGSLALAERLGRAALDESGSLAARLSLGYALAWQGRGREAGAVLAAVEPDTLSDTELMAWALPRAANQFWMLSEPERATAFLQTTRNRVSTPAARATLDALAATFAMNAGTPLSGLRMAEEVLASPHTDQVGVGWAASTAALCSARAGRFGDVEALAARALAVEHPGLLRFTSGFARITTLLMAGRLNAARSLAQRYTDFAELQQPGRAIGEVLVAYVAITQGEFATATALLEPAAATLERTGYSWGPLSLMLLTQALAQQGDQLAAAKVLSRAESRHGLKSALFAPELALARAWSKATRGDATGAIEAAREAVQAAERGGQSAIALRALQDATRLGDARAVYRAERLAIEVNCVLGRLTLAHARALSAGDADALADVAADLADTGLHPAAADAAAQAKPLR